MLTHSGGRVNGGCGMTSKIYELNCSYTSLGQTIEVQDFSSNDIVDEISNFLTFLHIHITDYAEAVSHGASIPEDLIASFVVGNSDICYFLVEQNGMYICLSGNEITFTSSIQIDTNSGE